MSGYVAGLVWKAKIPGAALTEKGILALYADVGHDDGTHIFRSKSTIAERAQTSKATIKRVTRWLLKTGILLVARTSSGGRYKDTTDYRIDVNLLHALAGDLGDGPFERATALVSENLKKQDDDDRGQDDPPVTQKGGQGEPGSYRPPTGVAGDPPGGSPMTPNTSRNRPRRKTPSEPTVLRESGAPTQKQLEAQFAELWAAYPHSSLKSRRAKPPALNAFLKLAKSNPAAPPRLIAAARAFGASDEAEREERRFTPGLGPWINKGFWEAWSDPDAPASGWDDAKWRAAARLHAGGRAWGESWPAAASCPAHLVAELGSALGLPPEVATGPPPRAAPAAADLFATANPNVTEGGNP